jgi:hypothetical protein
LPGFVLSRIAPLRLHLAVELAALYVVDAPLTGVRGEVALDRVSEGTRPGVLWWDTRAGWSLRRRCGRGQHEDRKEESWARSSCPRCHITELPDPPREHHLEIVSPRAFGDRIAYRK